jgi:ABC-type transporter Mla MlaB component
MNPLADTASRSSAGAFLLTRAPEWTPDPLWLALEPLEASAHPNNGAAELHIEIGYDGVGCTLTFQGALVQETQLTIRSVASMLDVEERIAIDVSRVDRVDAFGKDALGALLAGLHRRMRRTVRTVRAIPSVITPVLTPFPAFQIARFGAVG